MKLLEKKALELRERGIAWRITGIASRRLGWIADAGGIPVERLKDQQEPQENQDQEQGQKKRPQTGVPAPHSLGEWLAAARCDVLFEATSLNPQTGQPAIDHIRAALESGAHAITANKGPIVYAYEVLRALAAAKGCKFLFESTVMDGVPIFSMFRDSLPAVHLRGFHGILNSTTNVILSGMEEGLSFADSLKRAQEIGVAETEASHDIDGWDAAVKVAALVTVLMGVRISLNEIDRTGIGGLSGEAVRAARAEGKPYKLVCRAHREGSSVKASVRPEQVPLGDPMAWVAGTSSIVYFETDIFPGLVITENDPGVEATAYGMLADFVRAVSG